MATTAVLETPATPNATDCHLTESRTGRHKQRYSASGERLLAGCIPVRAVPQLLSAPSTSTAVLADLGVDATSTTPPPLSTSPSLASTVPALPAHATPSCSTTTTTAATTAIKPTSSMIEVLMVSSTRDADELVFPKGGWENDEDLKSAALRETMEEAGVGGVLTAQLGTYRYASKRRALGDVDAKMSCVAHMFAMRVDAVMDTWPEMSRGRVWIPAEAAAARCRHKWQADAVEHLLSLPPARVLNGELELDDELNGVEATAAALAAPETTDGEKNAPPAPAPAKSSCT